MGRKSGNKQNKDPNNRKISYLRSLIKGKGWLCSPSFTNARRKAVETTCTRASPPQRRSRKLPLTLNGLNGHKTAQQVIRDRKEFPKMENLEWQAMQKMRQLVVLHFQSLFQHFLHRLAFYDALTGQDVISDTWKVWRQKWWHNLYFYDCWIVYPHENW